MKKGKPIMRQTYGFFLLLVLASRVFADIAYLATDAQGYWQVWVIDEQSREQQTRQITRSPYDKNTHSWYPDGKQLLVNGSQGQLAVVAVATGKEHFIETPLQGFNDAALSPDGRYVAFSLSTSESQNDNNIWQLELATGQLHKLTNLPHLQHEPRWSADGKQLYFLSGRGAEDHDIWRVDIDSTSKRQLTAAKGYHFDIAISATGQLAYSGNQSGNYDIWLWPVQGERRPLTRHPGLDSSPDWSPDGEQLVFQSDRDGRANLWLLYLTSGKLKKLTHHKQGARRPNWLGAPQP